MSQYKQPKRTMHLESEPDDPEWIKKIAASIKITHNPPEYTEDFIHKLGYPKKSALQIAREQKMTQSGYKRLLAAIKYYKIHKSKDQLSENLLRQLYPSMSVAVIARLAHVSRYTVYRLLDKHGLRKGKNGSL
jgi:hypothetical protein